MTIEIIVAVDKNNGIGANNKLLWNIPEDMQRFRDITNGHTVVMGRKTWESIPLQRRPLINRKNIILTRDVYYKADGAIVINSVESLKDHVLPEDKVFIIGGSEVYRQFMGITDIIHLTTVNERFPEADTFFPLIDFRHWVVSGHEFKPTFSFMTLTRK